MASIAALLTFALVASAEMTSADLKRCPGGHTTLEDVPISYGLSTMEHKELERRINNLEFVLGGCEIQPDSPRVRPTCRTCRFGYDSRSKTWSKSSHDNTGNEVRSELNGRLKLRIILGLCKAPLVKRADLNGPCLVLKSREGCFSRSSSPDAAPSSRFCLVAFWTLAICSP